MGVVKGNVGARGLCAASVTHQRVCLRSTGTPRRSAGPGPLGRHLPPLSAAVCVQVSLRPARNTWAQSLSLAPGERPGGEGRWPAGLFSVQGTWAQPREGVSEPRSQALGGSLRTQGPSLPKAAWGSALPLQPGLPEGRASVESGPPPDGENTPWGRSQSSERCLRELLGGRAGEGWGGAGRRCRAGGRQQAEPALAGGGASARQQGKGHCSSGVRRCRRRCGSQPHSCVSVGKKKKTFKKIYKNFLQCP